MSTKMLTKSRLFELVNKTILLFFSKKGFQLHGGGGYNSVEATIELLRTALSNNDISFDRFVLLQGLEYPIRSNAEISAFFEKNVNVEFLKAQDISHSRNYHETHKFRLFWPMDDHSIFATILKKINLKLIGIKWVPPIRNNYAKIENKKMAIYQGAAQFGLTRKAAQYIVNFHDKNKKFNQYFKYVYAADEEYFHTIIYNSEFIKHTVDKKALFNKHITELENLTYFEYPDQVTLFSKKEDWPKLRDSGCLFFRKASSQSRELLDYIDAIHNKKDEKR